MQGGKRRHAAGALALAALCAGVVARAQAPADPPAERRERIEVTGSRLVSSDVESPSPIAILTAEEIRAAGYESLELILNNYPQLVADQGNRVSNGASGTSAANLRGLLPSRTLVLVNNRRLLAGSPFMLAGDLNQIPVHLVARIEILTGGASAVHGSDAIAGVVNVILKDRFEGVEGTLAHDFYNHRQKNERLQALVRAAGYELPGDKDHDGATTSATLTLGGNFAGDRGNATVSFRYLESEALLQSERDYSACALSIFDFRLPTQFEACGGSTTGFPGRITDAVSRRLWTLDAAGGVRPWVFARDAYNFAPWNYYQRPTERYGFNAFTHLDVTPTTRVYGELGFHDDSSVAQIAPSALFGGAPRTIRWENPLLTDAWRAVLAFRKPDRTPGTGPGTAASVVISRRNVEGGGRQSDLRHTSYREVFGAKGEIAEGWNFDAFFQAARVIASEVQSRQLSLTRIARALDVVPHPVTGAPVCASALAGTDPACVPYNLWSPGGVTPEALAYLEVSAFRSGYTAQSLLSATVRGDLSRAGLALPWTREPAEVAFGLERRTDKMDLAADDIFASGDLSGGGTALPSVSGRINVKEVFGELRLPVLDSLSVLAAYRYSAYSTGPRSNTFGLGFNAAPHKAVRLRGSLQRAVRAANLVELFEPQAAGGWGLGPDDEPCAGPSPRLPLDICRRTGVTAEQYGNIPRTPQGTGFAAIFGGNPALGPETATTFTLGLAFTPVRAFSATLDAFDFRVEDYITGGTPEVTFQRCLDTGEPLFCSLVRRDPTLGTLWLDPAVVVATNQNIGRVRTSGMDVSFDYRFGPRLSIAAAGTYMRSFSVERYRGADPIECAGYYSGRCAEPRPRWRHRVRATWELPWSLQVAAGWRYLGGVADVDGVAARLPPMSYLDLGATWRVDKRLTVRLAVDNVTDRDPPVAAGGGAPLFNGNTFVQGYDALGRHVSVSLNARF